MTERRNEMKRNIIFYDKIIDLIIVWSPKYNNKYVKQIDLFPTTMTDKKLTIVTTIRDLIFPIVNYY